MSFRKLFRTILIFFTIRKAIILDIWLEVVVATFYAAGIVYLDKLYKPKAELPKYIVDVVGVATGMLLVFRTNTAYDRFWEGRKLWSELTSSIRTLIRTFWVFMDHKNDSKILIEKLAVINLLVAFAYACKHYLREEYSYDEDDLVNLIGHLPHLISPSFNTSLKEQESIRFDRDEVEIGKRKTGHKSGKQYSKKHGTNIPLEISFYLSSFVKDFKERGIMDNPTSRITDNNLASILGCLSGFERIRRTPIPVAYLTHLTHVTWLVLFMLPIHWKSQLGWLAVPLMGITSFALLGILAIGNEIEDLDGFCLILQKEAIAMTSQPLPKLEAWVHTANHRPILFSSMNSLELAELSVKDVQRVLLRGKDFKITEDMKPNAGEAVDIKMVELEKDSY